MNDNEPVLWKAIFKLRKQFSDFQFFEHSPVEGPLQVVSGSAPRGNDPGRQPLHNWSTVPGTLLVITVGMGRGGRDGRRGEVEERWGKGREEGRDGKSSNRGLTSLFPPQ